MISKIFLCAFLAVGVLAEFEVTEEHREMIKLICKRNGGEDKIEQVTTAANTFVECVKGLFDPLTMQGEFMQHIHNYEGLKSMARKYCPKAPQLKGCARALSISVTPCLEQNTRKHMPDFLNSNDQFLDFVCLNDGDKIASFFSANGLECINSKMAEIQMCPQKISERIPPPDPATDLSLAERCAIVDEFSKCMVDALRGCSSPTPANILESLFEYTKISGCEKKVSNKIE